MTPALNHTVRGPYSKKVFVPLTPEEAERFYSNISSTPNEKGCLDWTGVKNQGYGMFSRRRAGKPWRDRAHRVAFALNNGGKWTPTLLVRHLCGNPACCNPEHLEEGTQKENLADAVRHGTSPRGDRNGSRTRPECLPRGDNHWAHKHPERVRRGEQAGGVKLTEHDVREIRLLSQSGVRQTQIAAKFGIDRANVS